MILLNLAVVTNLQNRNEEAINFARHSVVISAQSGSRDLEAAALLPLGLAQMELGHVEEAGRALKRSRDLFENNASPHLAMEPIAGLAQLALIEDDIDTAVAHVETILQHLEDDGSLDGTEEPLRIRWTMYKVLQEAGDRRAYSLLEETRRQLQIRAEKISDSRMRELFVRNVPHNMAIESAWQAQSRCMT